MAMATTSAASFRVGQKELFIPNVSIAFIRGNSPHEARFQVPLWFSKLDLRDYLWHAYQVEILGVRSYVKQQRVQSGKPNDIRPAIRRWHRPKAKKFMTVSLVRPFVWPERPEEHKEWNRKEVQAGDKETRKWQESMGSMSDAMVNNERRERMKEQAKALLEGKAKWKAPEERSRFNTSFLRGHTHMSIRAFSTTTHRPNSPPNKTECDTNRILHFADEQDAREDRYARIPQELPPGEVDGFEDCRRDKRAWVLKIMEAIQNTSPMTDMRVDPEYLRTSHQICVEQIKSKTEDPMRPHELERCAWLLLDEVWRLHRVGFRLVQYRGSPAHLENASWGTARKRFIPPLKCSKRLEAMVQAIKDVPLVARDVMRGANLVQLASLLIYLCWRNDGCSVTNAVNGKGIEHLQLRRISQALMKLRALLYDGMGLEGPTLLPHDSR